MACIHACDHRTEMRVCQRICEDGHKYLCGWSVVVGRACRVAISVGLSSVLEVVHIIPSLPLFTRPISLSVPLPISVRPHRIILVRHGQSEGNVDETAYTRIPDSKIALTHAVRHKPHTRGETQTHTRGETQTHTRERTHMHAHTYTVYYTHARAHVLSNSRSLSQRSSRGSGTVM